MLRPSDAIKRQISFLNCAMRDLITAFYSRVCAFQKALNLKDQKWVKKVVAVLRSFFCR